MRKILIAVAVAVCLTGCSGQSDDGPAPREQAAVDERPSEEPSPSPSPSPSSSPEPAGPMAFGESHTFANGVQVTVGVPKPFTPSEYAFAEGGKAYAAFAVTIVNTGDAPYDPSRFQTSVQSGNVEADPVYDRENGLEAPRTSLLAGREVAFRVGYAVDDPKDVVMEVRATYELGPIFYTNDGTAT